MRVRKCCVFDRNIFIKAVCEVTFLLVKVSRLLDLEFIAIGGMSRIPHCCWATRSLIQAMTSSDIHRSLGILRR